MTGHPARARTALLVEPSNKPRESTETAIADDHQLRGPR